MSHVHVICYSPQGPEHADCPSEADTTWGVTWSATQFGQVDVQRCPGGLDETVGKIIYSSFAMKLQ